MDQDNPANRGCPAHELLNTSQSANKQQATRYLRQSTKLVEKTNSSNRSISRGSGNTKSLNRIFPFGLVIILSCSIPSIIGSLLLVAEASPAAPVSELEASPFDFIKQQQEPAHSKNGADPAVANFASGTDRRSLPYSATNNQQQQQQQPQPQHQFDPSSYKNIYEAIRNHPDLREFADLCEADEVREIVNMDRTPLTVFAPIDKSLRDLLAKSKSRSSINLIELAKHHIAQGLVTPDEYNKYPLQFNDYALLSPLYLNQLPASTGASASASASAGARKGQQSGQVFVNNAKILATYLIPIGSDNFQALHLIDQVIEFAYISRRALLAPSGGSKRKTATKKSKFNLDDLLNSPDQQQVTSEFYERFGDLQTDQHQVDLYHARAYNRFPEGQRLQIDREELNLERLARLIRQHPKLRAKLFQVNESSSYNTYFLPMNNDELASLLDKAAPPSKQLAALEALVIPDQVLFTRLMPLGSAHSTLFDRSETNQRVSLSLAKTLPLDDDQQIDSDAEDTQTNSKRLLSTPLLLQAKCYSRVGASSSQESAGESCRPGVTSAELLVANIPLSNGVLHLIKRPLLLADQPVLNYLNDNENQLTNLVTALGSRTAAAAALMRDDTSPIKVNRFRELLARERQMLSIFSSTADGNKTLLVPSDKAFASLRYDLRALVQGDESLIPREWSQSYRQDLLERLVKSHIVAHESITTDQLDSSSNQQLQALSDNGRSLMFVRKSYADDESASADYYVECDSTRAQLVQHDLIGSNGVVHIIDRVLGEDQETVHSLLKSIVLKYNNSLLEDSPSVSAGELSQLVQSSIRNNKQQQQQQQQQQISDMPQPNPASQQQADSAATSPELAAISKSIGQYLDEIANSNKRQMQLLASSVNISYQLARLTSLAEGLDDWNDKFRQSEKLFTYFVPSDLAWIRLQQAQPELYKPLMYFLEHQTEDSSGSAVENGIVESSKPTAARSSESSHRLRQILERHLVLDRKIDARNLNQLDSVKTMGATLRLVESPSQSQLTATYSAGDSSNLSGQQQSAGNFAALHSIFSGTSSAASAASPGQPTQPAQPRLKSLKLQSASANIVQANEASNGFVYVIDSVLLLPEDANYIVLTGQSPAASSAMSSLLGGHQSAIFDFVHGFLAPAPFNMSTGSTLALMATLTAAILVLLVLALVLVVRKSRQQSKQNRHQQLESGLTSSSSANSGSTSTTKSL